MHNDEASEPLRNWWIFPLLPFCAGLVVHAAALWVLPCFTDDAELGAVLASLLAILALGLAGYLAVVRRECDSSVVAVSAYLVIFTGVLGLLTTGGLLVISLLFGGLIYLLLRMSKVPLWRSVPQLTLLPSGFITAMLLHDVRVSGIAAVVSVLFLTCLLYVKRS